MKWNEVLIAAGLSLAIGATPASSSDESDAAAAALLLLGVAALSHHDDHYREGYRPKQGRQIAEFERGFRDGLYNESYSVTNDSRDYSEGYAAGHKERRNRLAHKRGNVQERRGIPRPAIRGCRREVASTLGRDIHNIHMQNSRKLGPNDILIEVAVGRRHLVCEMTADGRVRRLRNGTL